MDIAIVLNRLGVKPEELKLSSAIAPNHIVEWVGGDPQPTQAELDAEWQNYLAEKPLLDAKEAARKLNYKGFWKQLVRSTAYGVLKTAAKASLEANVMATELISVMSDAKANDLDYEVLQVSLNELFGSTVLGDTEKAELSALLDTFSFNTAFTY